MRPVAVRVAIDQRLMECKRWHPPLVRGQGRATRPVYLSPRQFCKWCLHDYARSACNSPAKVNEAILACYIWYFNNLLRFVSKRPLDTTILHATVSLAFGSNRFIISWRLIFCRDRIFFFSFNLSALCTIECVRTQFLSIVIHLIEDWIIGLSFFLDYLDFRNRRIGERRGKGKGR